jgi:hypothetical protein
MKKILLGIAVIFFFGFGFFLFQIMGGFNDIKVELVDLGTLELSGISFRGRPQDEALRDAFVRIEALQQENQESKIHTIYFSEPAGRMDTMEVFVGLEKKWVSKEEALEELTFDANQAIVAQIKAHRFVMPGPVTVKSKIIDFAKKNSLPESRIFIDRILGPDEVMVIAVKE